MRRLAVLTAAAALAAGGTFLAAPAGAYQCPQPLLENDPIYVEPLGRSLPGCRLAPIIYCDPGPCDPWLAR